MRGTFKFVSPNDLEASLTITMTIADWRLLKDQLRFGEQPSWQLSQLIGDVVTAAERHFYAVDPPPPADS